MARQRHLVTDENGAVIPGSTVTATGASTNTRLTVKTGGDGSYAISSPPGTYIYKRVIGRADSEDRIGRMELLCRRKVI